MSNYMEFFFKERAVSGNLVFHPSYTLLCMALAFLFGPENSSFFASAFALALLLPESCTWILALSLCDVREDNISEPYFPYLGNKDTTHIVYLKGLLALHKLICKKILKEASIYT